MADINILLIMLLTELSYTFLCVILWFHYNSYLYSPC